jgi:hypothetical protein
MRDAAMVLEIGDRAGVADDEIEVRRCGGKEAGSEAPGLRVFRPCGAGDQRARQRVRQGVQDRVLKQERPILRRKMGSVPFSV